MMATDFRQGDRPSRDEDVYEDEDAIGTELDKLQEKAISASDVKKLQGAVAHQPADLVGSQWAIHVPPRGAY
jgi:hypothetical protein